MPPPQPPSPRKGRGALSNREGRYESRTVEAWDDGWLSDEPEERPLRTTVTLDRSRSIIARNDSPDIPFDRSINPYRGCEHGCIYCYARPTHAYLGLSPGLDFESRLFAKPDAARLLAEELRHPGYRCRLLAMGTNTDPYQPAERSYGITRQILQVLAEFGHPVSIVTKSSRIEHDIDILAPMAERGLAEVNLSVTTLDRGLARRMEPRACAPQRRIEAIRRLSAAGIPVGVMVAPVVPVLTDGDMERILEASAAAGASSAGYILLRLPLEVADLFEAWLEAHVPLKAARVMSRVRDVRGGRANDPRFGKRMVGSGEYAELIGKRFRLAVRRLGLDRARHELDTSQFHVPASSGDQLSLF
jgi:DNA repair photolyase